MLLAETTTGHLPSDIQWIPLAKIRTDHAVNTRPVDFGWVDRRVETFDPDKLGVPIVSKRDDGTYVWLDGQNRGELCRRVGWADQDIQCRVFTGLTTAQEAVLFLGHNDNRQVTPFFKFMARITAGEPDAVAINRIANEAGWELSSFGGDRRLTAVVALERIYLTAPKDVRRGATLARTFAIATTAWGYGSDTVNGGVLLGLGLVCNRYGDAIDTAALTKRLTAHRGGALGVLGDARGLRAYSGGTIPSCVAETIVRIYNSKRRQGALPAWRVERNDE